MEKIVLQKFIVDSGHCSRRRATELIKAGKVKMNGKAAEPGMKVGKYDSVLIGNKKIKRAKEKIYIILNKPEGYVCTNRRFEGEKNVFELLIDKTGKLPQLKERLFVVGRLDKNSQGLVLLTNDGGLAQRITHPSYDYKKEYIVKVEGAKLDIKNVKKNFIKGVYVGEGDGVVKAKEIEYLGENNFSIVLTSGKKRQIRRMFSALDIKVVSLRRVSISSKQFKLDLGELEKGKWRCLCEEDVRKLKR